MTEVKTHTKRPPRYCPDSNKYFRIQDVPEGTRVYPVTLKGGIRSYWESERIVGRVPTSQPGNMIIETERIVNLNEKKISRYGGGTAVVTEPPKWWENN